ncbi:MAG: MarR family transcriptional regulator [Rhodospirillales bacterium]|nr:MarR family transcriptional regulator [Rhodospirillales bacterium]
MAKEAASELDGETVHGDARAFDLRSFFPYLVRTYYQAVSASVTQIYGPLHGLSVSEWRTMAVLGSHRVLSASEIVERSSMDRVAVSRAIKGLREAGLLKRDIDGDDQRRAVLRLTPKGSAVFHDLVPRVRALEEDLLAGLSAKERQTLLSLMARVRDNALSLAG